VQLSRAERNWPTAQLGQKRHVRASAPSKYIIAATHVATHAVLISNAVRGRLTPIHVTGHASTAQVAQFRARQAVPPRVAFTRTLCVLLLFAHSSAQSSLKAPPSRTYEPCTVEKSPAEHTSARACAVELHAQKRYDFPAARPPLTPSAPTASSKVAQISQPPPLAK
jgi:hypothetical protein